MYINIDAASTLGVSNIVIERKVKRKGLRKAIFADLMRSKYTPNKHSEFFVNRISEINNDLNTKEGVSVPNPYFQAFSGINKIISENRNIYLIDGEVNFFEEEKPVISSDVQIQTPPLGSTPTPDPDIVQTQTPLTSEQTINRIRAFGGR